MNDEQTMNNLVIQKKKNKSCRGLEHLVFIYLLFIHKEMKATHQWV